MIEFLIDILESIVNLFELIPSLFLFRFDLYMGVEPTNENGKISFEDAIIKTKKVLKKRLHFAKCYIHNSVVIYNDIQKQHEDGGMGVHIEGYVLGKNKKKFEEKIIKVMEDLGQQNAFIEYGSEERVLLKNNYYLDEKQTLGVSKKTERILYNFNNNTLNDKSCVIRWRNNVSNEELLGIKEKIEQYISNLQGDKYPLMGYLVRPSFYENELEYIIYRDPKQYPSEDRWGEVIEEMISGLKKIDIGFNGWCYELGI